MEVRARAQKATARQGELSDLTDAELHDFEAAMLVHWAGLSEDEAWCAAWDHCCCYHPYDWTDPGTAMAVRAAIARRLDFLCRWLPTSRHAIAAELADSLRDLRVWRRVIARTYELDRHGPTYEGRVAEALQDLAA